jgi:hypothetical protein
MADGEPDQAVAQSAETPAGETTAAAQAFAEKLARRLPPNEVELAAIERAKKRTKARAPRVTLQIDERGTSSPHSDVEGNRYRLADAFGTRSIQFVHSMLNGLGKATEDHSEYCGFRPGSPDQEAFNAALAVIDGVRPKDEIEAMLAAHTAVTNIALLELVARTRGAIAGHLYHGTGIKRLDVLGNLTTKFMRTYTMQVEALARKRRKGEQNVTVKYVHVHAGGQAVVGNVSHRGGRGAAKNEQRAYRRGRQEPTAVAISESPSVRSGTRSGKPCRSPATEKGRCRLHGGARGSGGPPGKRNGQYRHGERTKAAIAERQKFSALLKMLRAGLT